MPPQTRCLNWGPGGSAGAELCCCIACPPAVQSPPHLKISEQHSPFSWITSGSDFRFQRHELWLYSQQDYKVLLIMAEKKNSFVHWCTPRVQEGACLSAWSARWRVCNEQGHLLKRKYPTILSWGKKKSLDKWLQTPKLTVHFRRTVPRILCIQKFALLG